jgi:broad specificity phosphatase PhoE
MTTTIHLVRHAETDAVGCRLVGRLPGVTLNARGRAQAADLAAVFARATLALVVSSPLERAVDTARPIADGAGCPLHVDPALNEIDFGCWSGRTFAALADDPDWGTFNAEPEAARVPGGESVPDVADRASAALARLVAAHAGREVVVVSHGDVLRLAIARALGMPLDGFRRLTIDPAAITCLDWDRGGAVLRHVNTPVAAWREAGAFAAQEA